MADESRVRIKQLLEVTNGAWHVVTHNRDMGEGAVLKRVACWAVISAPEGDRVVAMFGDLDNQCCLDFYRYDHPDVIGLAEPGDDRTDWDDVAKQLRDAEREEETRKEHEELSPRIAEMLSSTDVMALRAMLAGDKKLIPSDINILELAELGLITLWKPSSGDPRHTWVITSLGRTVCAELDKRKR